MIVRNKKTGIVYTITPENWQDICAAGNRKKYEILEETKQEIILPKEIQAIQFETKSVKTGKNKRSTK